MSASGSGSGSSNAMSMEELLAQLCGMMKQERDSADDLRQQLEVKEKRLQSSRQMVVKAFAPQQENTASSSAPASLPSGLKDDLTDMPFRVGRPCE